MRGKFFVLQGIFISICIRVWSQDVDIHSGFSSDSIRIGEPVPFHVSVYYPENLKILLPDSAFKYGEFEYTKRIWFPTLTQNKQARDSVIYYFTTFNIDSVLYLQLPVYIIQESDCITLYSPRDSLFLKQVINQPADTLKLRADTAMLKVGKALNYPVILAALGILVFLSALIIILFGKKIAKRFRIYRMKRKYRIFTRRFYFKLSRIRDFSNGLDPEKLLLDWKKYMESLENEPYTKLTTRELIQMHNDPGLVNDLRAIDRYIYGNVKEKPLHEHFSKLLEYTVTRFQARIKEEQHGL